jgi:hypothetical protein
MDASGLKFLRRERDISACEKAFLCDIFGCKKKRFMAVCRGRVAVPCVQGSEDCLFDAGVPLAVSNPMRGISLPELSVAAGIAMAVRSCAPASPLPRGTHGRNDRLLFIKCWC